MSAKHCLVKLTSPLHWLGQCRRVRDISSLPELHDFPLPLFFLDNRESCIRKVHVTLRTCLEAASPSNHIDEATLVAIRVGDAKYIDEAVLEGYKCAAERFVEALVESPRTIKIIMCVIECEF